MRTYKSNYRYKLIFFEGILFTLLCAAIGGIFISCGYSVRGLIVFLPGVLICYLLLFIIPQDITVRENRITYKTMISSKTFYFSQIRNVRSYYSSKSLQAHAGNKEKADMLCIITLKEKPLRFFLFSDEIYDYKELCSYILFMMEREEAINSSRVD